MIYLVRFKTGRNGNIFTEIGEWICFPNSEGPQPKPGETWLVEIIKPAAQSNQNNIRHLRLVQQLNGILTDKKGETGKIIGKKMVGRIDLKSGVLCFSGNNGYQTTLPLENTKYSSIWNDYKFLLDNPNAVIIRDGKAILWRKKGKFPKIMPLARFATKYKRQTLVGDQEQVDYFLKSLKELRDQVILKKFKSIVSS
jgi:hypothetical protein